MATITGKGTAGLQWPTPAFAEANATSFESGGRGGLGVLVAERGTLGAAAGF